MSIPNIKMSSKKTCFVYIMIRMNPASIRKRGTSIHLHNYRRLAHQLGPRQRRAMAITQSCLLLPLLLISFSLAQVMCKSYTVYDIFTFILDQNCNAKVTFFMVVSSGRGRMRGRRVPCQHDGDCWTAAEALLSPGILPCLPPGNDQGPVAVGS